MKRKNQENSPIDMEHLMKYQYWRKFSVQISDNSHTSSSIWIELNEEKNKASGESSNQNEYTTRADQDKGHYIATRHQEEKWKCHWDLLT